jgi:hypothetical protein
MTERRSTKGVWVSELNISLAMEIRMPREYLGAFILAFGDLFTTENAKGTIERKTIDGYHLGKRGCSARLTIAREDKDKFYAFVKEFCRKKRIQFR